MKTLNTLTHANLKQNVQANTGAVDAGAFVRDGVGASRVYCPVGTWGGVLDFLCAQFPAISRQQWCDRITSGAVLNHRAQPLAIDAAYIAGQTLYYFRNAAAEPRLPYIETVLYQDEYLVVADKPHFLPVVPSGKYVQETLLVRLKKRLNLPELSPIHRIDRDTAGLVMFCVQAKHRNAYQALFRQGLVRKTYHAIAPVNPSIHAFTLPHKIENCLKSAAHFMQMQTVNTEPPNTLTYIMDVQPIVGPNVELNRATTIDPAAMRLAMYTLQPHTGKRHQLRMHMLSIGAPIIGDCIYPELLPERDITIPGLLPMQLLAKRLEFTDPVTHSARLFESKQQLTYNGQ